MRAQTFCSVQLTRAAEPFSVKQQERCGISVFQVSAFYTLLTGIIRDPLKYPIPHRKSGWLLTLGAVMGLGRGCCQAQACSGWVRGQRAGLLFSPKAGKPQIFQQLGGEEECPPLESEDEFRIEPSCFCSGKSKLSELFQPFQISIFLLLQLTEASSYLCTDCAQGKERKLELHSDEATGKSHSPLQTYRIITSHYMVFSPAARFVSSLSWQSRSGV